MLVLYVHKDRQTDKQQTQEDRQTTHVQTDYTCTDRQKDTLHTYIHTYIQTDRHTWLTSSECSDIIGLTAMTIPNEIA